LLTATPRVSLARIRNIPQVFRASLVLSGFKESFAGCKLNPRVEAEPHVFTCEFSGFSG